MVLLDSCLCARGWHLQDAPRKRLGVSLPRWIKPEEEGWFCTPQMLGAKKVGLVEVVTACCGEPLRWMYFETRAEWLRCCRVVISPLLYKKMAQATSTALPHYPEGWSVLHVKPQFS